MQYVNYGKQCRPSETYDDNRGVDFGDVKIHFVDIFPPTIA